MRGDVQASTLRLLPSIMRVRWFSLAARGRRNTREQELEIIERLARHEREARRSGAYVPKLGPEWRWH